jgi:aspartyl-tRNA synthetase
LSSSRSLYRTHLAGELSPGLVGKKVRLAGWIEDVRPVGALLFITLRDSSGKAQVVFKRGELNDAAFSALQAVPRQSAVSVTGVVAPTKARELSVELVGEELEVLSEAKHPLPLDPTGRVPASLDTRLDHRPLELRSPSSSAVFRLRSALLRAFRAFLHERGFIEVNTPKIISAGAEGGATLFKVDYFGRPAYLAQSPQLYKEQLMLAFDRVFELAQYFRAEKSHTTRHLNEFTMLDVEMAFATEEEVMALCEELIEYSVDALWSDCAKEIELLGLERPEVKRPFPRYRYVEVLEALREAGLVVREGEDLTDAQLKAFSEGKGGFYFIVEWPASLKPFYVEEDERGYSYSFDLQWGELELASGGRRVHRRERLESRIAKQGLPLDSFRSHLAFFEYGMPPHAGMGFGFDRFLQKLTRRQNIREVVLYPRDRFRLLP